MPVWDKSERQDGAFCRSDFAWDGQADEYRCQGGKDLRRDRRPFKQPRTHAARADAIIYRASAKDCADCPMKARCCPGTPFRKIARSVHEDARKVARGIGKTEAFLQSSKDRKNSNFCLYTNQQ